MRKGFTKLFNLSVVSFIALGCSSVTNIVETFDFRPEPIILQEKRIKEAAMTNPWLKRNTLESILSNSENYEPIPFSKTCIPNEEAIAINSELESILKDKKRSTQQFIDIYNNYQTRLYSCSEIYQRRCSLGVEVKEGKAYIVWPLSHERNQRLSKKDIEKRIAEKALFYQMDFDLLERIELCEIGHKLYSNPMKRPKIKKDAYGRSTDLLPSNDDAGKLDSPGK